jgi:predicted  nucleic acid-binding Zn-ribbon protein
MREPMRYLSLWVMAALVAGGCANYKEPARIALQDVGYSMQAAAGDAKKYVPDQYAKLEQEHEAAKASFASGDYKNTVAQVRALRQHISQVSSAAAAARDQMAASLNQQWQAMSADLPKMVDAIGKRIDSLSKSKKLPKDLTPTNFEAAKAGYEDVKKAWSEASQASDAGNIETAVSKGTAVQTKGQEVMTLLGMSA